MEHTAEVDSPPPKKRSKKASGGGRQDVDDVREQSSKVKAALAAVRSKGKAVAPRGQDQTSDLERASKKSKCVVSFVSLISPSSLILWMAIYSVSTNAHSSTILTLRAAPVKEGLVGGITKWSANVPGPGHWDIPAPSNRTSSSQTATSTHEKPSSSTARSKGTSKTSKQSDNTQQKKSKPNIHLQVANIVSDDEAPERLAALSSPIKGAGTRATHNVCTSSGSLLII